MPGAAAPPYTGLGGGGGRLASRVVTAVVVVETLLLALMALLVGGLLRSHAEILRRLDELQPGGSATAAPARASAAAHDVSGVTLAGDALHLGVTRPGQRDAARVPDVGLQHLPGLLGGLRRPAHAAAGGRAARRRDEGREPREPGPAARPGARRACGS